MCVIERMFLCDINVYVEKNNLIDTFDTLEMFGIVEKFKLTEECQKRCFVALQQLLRRKVQPFLYREYKICALYKYFVCILA